MGVREGETEFRTRSSSLTVTVVRMLIMLPWRVGGVNRPDITALSNQPPSEFRTLPHVMRRVAHLGGRQFSELPVAPFCSAQYRSAWRSISSSAFRRPWRLSSARAAATIFSWRAY